MAQRISENIQTVDQCNLTHLQMFMKDVDEKFRQKDEDIKQLEDRFFKRDEKTREIVQLLLELMNQKSKEIQEMKDNMGKIEKTDGICSEDDMQENVWSSVSMGFSVMVIAIMTVVVAIGLVLYLDKGYSMLDENDTETEMFQQNSHDIIAEHKYSTLESFLRKSQNTASLVSVTEHNYNSLKTFKEKISALQSRFSQQQGVYWGRLRDGGLEQLQKIHMENVNIKPQAYFIAGYAGSRKTLDCFISQLAGTFSDSYQNINLDEFVEKEDKNLRIVEVVKSKLQGKNRVLVVRDIDKLKFADVLLLVESVYSQNNFCMQSLILFSTELPSSYHRIYDTDTVRAYFDSVVWRDAPSDELETLWYRLFGDRLTMIHEEDPLSGCD